MKIFLSLFYAVVALVALVVLSSAAQTLSNIAANVKTGAYSHRETSIALPAVRAMADAVNIAPENSLRSFLLHDNHSLIMESLSSGISIALA